MQFAIDRCLFRNQSFGIMGILNKQTMNIATTKIFTSFFGFLCIATIGSVFAAESMLGDPKEEAAETFIADGPDFVENEVLVVIDPNAEEFTSKAGAFTTLSSESGRNELYEQIIADELSNDDVEITVESFFQTADGSLNVQTKESDALITAVITSETQTVTELEEFLAETELFSHVGPNWLFYPTAENATDLWGTYNNNNDAGVAANRAWQMGATGEGVVVAVVDTGVHLQHPDLQANIWRNGGETDCSNGRDDDNNGFTDDCYGWDFANDDNNPNPDPRQGEIQSHGTHVAGTVAAIRNNTGIVGVAPDAKIMPIRVIADTGGTTMPVLMQAAEYAIANGADVINMSLGGRMACTRSMPLHGLDQILNRNNVMLVSASGNDGPNRPSTPASCPGVIGVGATDNRKRLAGFSSYVPGSVDVVAPGVNIASTVINGYDRMSGTSMASPHTAGVIALMKSMQPNLSNDEITRLLCEHAEDIGRDGPDTQTGCGFNDASKLIEAIRGSNPGTGNSGNTNSCSSIRTGQTPPTGFGSPTNFFTNQASLAIDVSCTDVAQVSISSDPNMYVYNRGYVLRNNQWVPITYSGTVAVAGSPWLIGDAQTSISGLNLRENNVVLGYFCMRVNNQWKCGCRDEACQTPMWNVQSFRAQ
jgi:subtilisin family serine protease